VKWQAYRLKTFDYERAKNSIIYALDKEKEEAQKEAILKAKNEHDSVGGVSRVIIKGATYWIGTTLVL
jgi:Chorismate synthase